MATANTTQIKITGDVAGALSALETLGIKAEETGGKVEGAFGDKVAGKLEGTGNLFSKLGNTISMMGLPFGESFAKMGERIEEADTEGKKFGQTMVELGKVAAVAGVAGIAIAAKEAIDLGENFQMAEAKIAASAGITTKQAAAIGNAFLSTAGKTTFSAQTIAEAYAGVAGQLGTVNGKALDAKQALGVMSAAMDLAEATGSNLSTTTSSLATVLQAYGLNINQASHASDILFNASRMTGNSLQQVEQVAVQLKTRLGAAAPSLQDTGGLMLDLASHGIAGSRGIRTITQSLTSLLSPSTGAQKALAAMGISLTDKQGKFVGMGPALDLLREGLAKLPPVLNQGTEALEKQNVTNEITQLGLEKATPAITKKLAALKQESLTLTEQGQAYSKATAEQALFGKNGEMLLPLIDSGSAVYNKFSLQVGKVGSAHEAAEKQADTFKGTLEKLESTGEDLGTRLGLVLIPIVTKLGQVVANATNYLMKHRDILIALGVVVGGFLTLAMTAFAVNTIGNMITRVGEAGKSIVTLIGKMGLFREAEVEGAAVSEETGGGFGPIGIAIGAIILVIMLLATHWKQVWSDIKKWTSDAFEFLKRTFSTWGPIVATLFLGPIGGAAVAVITHWKAVENAADGLFHFLDGIWQDVDRDVRNWFGDVLNFFEQLPGNIGNAMANVGQDILWPFTNLPTLIVNNVINPLISLFERLPGEIIHALGDISKDIVNTILKDVPGGGLASKVLSHIPGLASGGIVTSPTFALIGEAGPEMVIPLNQYPLYGFNGSAQPLPGGRGGAAPGGVNVNQYIYMPTATPQQVMQEATWKLNRLVT